MIKNLFIILSFIFLSHSAWSFPEMIRQHYVNCSACHVSQAGGGVLNSYGRTISYDLLSTWGGEAESRPFYLVDSEKVNSKINSKINSWLNGESKSSDNAWLNNAALNLGGDLRGIQLHQENKQVKAGRYIWMQAAIDGALTVGPMTAMLSFGQVRQSDQSFLPYSTKYYLSYQATDELSVRAGRVIPLFGLQIPQHQYFVKDTLSLGQGSERDTAETIYNGELWNFAFAYSQSNAKSTVRDVENALSAQVQRTVNDSHKLGVSLWSGQANTFKKSMVGVHAVSGWTEKFYTLAEVDHVSKIDRNANDKETRSIYELFKAGYEMYKGFHAQFVQQYGKANLDTDLEKQSAGVGAIWYPRPHFEFEAVWNKQRDLAVSNTFEDYAYILTHFYF